MVAISLYRGNLHRVPDVHRKWLVPTPTISLKDFKILLHRRSRALARLHSTPTSSNPNPNPNPNVKKEEEEEENLVENNVPPPKNNFQPPSPPPPQPDPQKSTATTTGHREEERAVKEEGNDTNGLEGGDALVKPLDGSDASRGVNCDSRDEKEPEALENPKAEEMRS